MKLQKKRDIRINTQIAKSIAELSKETWINSPSSMKSRAPTRNYYNDVSYIGKHYMVSTSVKNFETDDKLDVEN